MHLLIQYTIAIVASFAVIQSPDCSTENATRPAVAGSQGDEIRGQKASYDFHHPDKTYELPPILKEISGIAVADARTLYCIQDEKGIVYKYDLHHNEISASIPFGTSGDYEDIAIVHDDIYVLRSDATIFVIDQKNPAKTKQYTFPASCTDVEGFFYAAPENLLYVACKNSDKGRDGSERTISQFSPGDIAHPKPFLMIDQDDIRKTSSQQSQTSGKGKLQFNPSGLAVHPRTGELYVLSASDRYLAVFKNALVQQVYRLPADIYFQPEGIAFAGNGDLYLSSEGMKKESHGGRIYYFAFK